MDALGTVARSSNRFTPPPLLRLSPLVLDSTDNVEHSVASERLRVKVSVILKTRFLDQTRRRFVTHSDLSV